MREETYNFNIQGRQDKELACNERRTNMTMEPTFENTACQGNYFLTTYSSY